MIHDMKPPFSLEAETAVLGALLVDPECAADVRAVVEPSDFYREANRRLLPAMLDVIEEAGRVDVIGLADRLKASGELDAVGGFEYLSALIDAVPSAANVEYHARIVRDKASLRRLIEACHSTIRDAMEGESAKVVLHEAEARFLTATERAAPADGFRPASHAVEAAMTMIHRAAESRGGVVGIRSGIPSLDDKTAGFEPGGVTVLAARPAMGKSAMAWQFAERAAMDGEGVLVASYEMGAGQLGRRGLARLSHVDSNRIRRGDMTREEWSALSEAGKRLAGLPIWINDRPPHQVETLRSMIHRHRRTHPARLVIVDYLQQMSGPKSGNRNNEVEHISRGLKRMAMELDVHVIALAQLSRGVEHRSPPRPVLSDLRDSGAIEQDADNVLLLWRPEYYFDDTTPPDARAKWGGKAELLLAKQRDGETGKVRLVWDGPHLIFTEHDDSARWAA